MSSRATDVACSATPSADVSTSGASTPSSSIEPLECRTVGTPYTDRHYRIARFVPDADGELQYANQFPIGEQQPGDNERHLFIDNQDHLWVVPRDGTQIFELSADLVELRRIDFRELTKINQITGRV
jgi:hypothetical protein